MDECIRLYQKFTNCKEEEAIRNATQNPAKVLHIDHMKGDLLPGMDADFVFLDADLNVQATYVGGNLAWKRTVQ